MKKDIMSKWLIIFLCMMVSIIIVCHGIVCIYTIKIFCFNHVNYVIGRDTVCYVGDAKYQIYKTGGGGICLDLHDNNGLNQEILNPVNNYKRKGNVMYVKGLNGIAVIYGKDNTCKLMLYGEPTRRFDNITYIKSYGDFTHKERKMFEKMG